MPFWQLLKNGIVDQAIARRLDCRMKFPLIVIDFEASSLNSESYPIEVGVAVARSAAGPIEAWSSLIQPSSAWIQGNDWDPASEKIHGISRSELNKGRAAFEVATGLNRLIEPNGHAWCDGGRYDGHWQTKLFEAASLKPAYELWDISGLFSLDRSLRDRFGYFMAQSAAEHRAGEDALRISAALLLAAGHASVEAIFHIDEFDFRDYSVDGE